MTVTSFWFFVLLLIGGTVYYLVPKQGQWVILLLLSLAFYHFAAEADYALLFPLLSSVIAYVSGLLLQKEQGKTDKKSKKIIWFKGSFGWN